MKFFFFFFSLNKNKKIESLPACSSAIPKLSVFPTLRRGLAADNSKGFKNEQSVRVSGPAVVRDVTPLLSVEHGAARSSALRRKVPLLFFGSRHWSFPIAGVWVGVALRSLLVPVLVGRHRQHLNLRYIFGLPSNQPMSLGLCFTYRFTVLNR